MIEPELQRYLSGINQTLTEIKNKKPAGIWHSFFNGVFSAVGYFVGLTIVIVVLGWFVNKTGLFASFKRQVDEFQDFMNQAKRAMTAGESSQQNANEVGNIYTLPDGTKVQVVK